MECLEDWVELQDYLYPKEKKHDPTKGADFNTVINKWGFNLSPDDLEGLEDG